MTIVYDLAHVNVCDSADTMLIVAQMKLFDSDLIW